PAREEAVTHGRRQARRNLRPALLDPRQERRLDQRAALSEILLEVQALATVESAGASPEPSGALSAGPMSSRTRATSLSTCTGLVKYSQAPASRPRRWSSPDFRAE